MGKYETREEFINDLRKACRKVYAEQYDFDPQINAAIGDALAFYVAITGIDFKSARALAQACFFYVNDVIAATDSELLGVKGIGLSRLRGIRRAFEGEPLPDHLSVSDLLDSITGKSDPPVPFPLPRRSEFLMR